MTTPIRIQRQRTKGWKMPPNTVYVGRPTQWGNPYKAGDIIEALFSTEAVDVLAVERVVITAQKAVDLFEARLTRWSKGHIRAHFRGKNLACFCRLDQPCHADVLLKIANGDEP